MTDPTLYVSDAPHGNQCGVSIGSPAGQVVMTAHTTWVPAGDARRLTARVVHAANCHADLLAACRRMLAHPTCVVAFLVTQAAVAKATGADESPDA